MPPPCAIIGCNMTKQIARDTGLRISFFQIPKNEYLREQWLNNCKPKINLTHAIVCSLHFQDDDFLNYWMVQLLKDTKTKLLLKKDAVPSQRLGQIFETTINTMSVCRACMVKNEGMDTIFSTVKQYDTTLSEMFTDCTSLGVTKNDGLPEYLCEICVKKLQEWFEFKTMSSKSHETFHADLAKGSVNEVNIVDLLCSESKLLDQKKQPKKIKPSKSEKHNDTTKQKKTYMCGVCGLYFINLKSLNTHFISHTGLENGVSDLVVRNKESTEQINDELSPEVKENQKNEEEKSNDQIEEAIMMEVNEKTIIDESELLNQQNLPNSSDSPNPSEPEKRKEKKKYKRQKRPSMCDICGLCFAYSGSLRSHRLIHTGVKNWVCELCGKKYSTLYNLKIHMHTHDEVKLNHQCTQCPKTFYAKRELEKHVRIHTGERPFKCPICSKAFRLKFNMNAHYEKHEKQKNKSYVCEKCNKSYDSEISLQKHVKTTCRFRNDQNNDLENESREVTVFPCHICDKEFRSKLYLKTHLLRHTANRPYVCKICNRNFSEETTLDAHLKFHARPKPFQCEVCEKRFIDRSALRCHTRTHTGEKPFECEVCTKKFASKMSLKYHVRIHTGEKPFKCSICNISFSQRSSHLHHSLVVHNGEASL